MRDPISRECGVCSQSEVEGLAKRGVFEGWSVVGGESMFLCSQVGGRVDALTLKGISIKY